tara:strand:+ start:1689 stop:2684 length:996 start_codon:yes stop_codon:yes gene_type:complete
LIINKKEDLITKISELKLNNLRIGTISGSFDCFHEGHKFSLDFSVKEVDKLIVLVNSDKSVSTYKGKNRPLQNIDERIKALVNFSPNNFYYVFDELVPNKILGLIKPDIHFISRDWSKNPVERYVVEENGGKLMEHPHLSGVSTTINLEKQKRTEKINKAIFLDRDGTINEDVGYLNNLEDINISQETLDGLEKISKLDYLNIIVTNQSGVERGYLTKETLNEINRKIKEIIEQQNGRIDHIYFDTSTPENPSKNRKPKNGMVVMATEEYNLSLKNSWVIGDRDTDIELGKMCNMKSVLIRNERYEYKSKIKPDYIVNNLLEAYDVIISKN